MKFVKIIFALVGLTFVFVFCSSNETKVSLNFLEYSTPETYLFLYVLSAFVLGMIAASFCSTIKIFQLKRQLGKLQPVSDQDSSAKKKKKDKKNKGKDDVKQDVVDEPKASRESAPTTVSTPATAGAVADAIYEEEVVETTVEPVQDVIELPLDSPAQPQNDEKKE
ncbi:MAG: hypothetical protein B6I37_01475 [Desulfobacteraceae bacterium 4572_35.2]|nr:MAG: hypothetical protein B6I37_01475 [Desulfobacteraceae bacterium 4572_35.2]